ncbi:hypothetical protein D030_3456A, partial [Vibrio parahaemolyticus AQ3810]
MVLLRSNSGSGIG